VVLRLVPTVLEELPAPLVCKLCKKLVRNDCSAAVELEAEPAVELEAELVLEAELEVELAPLDELPPRSLISF
jgi:hypothetical protein